MEGNENNVNKEAKWYVVHTYSGYENKVSQKIQMMIDNGKAKQVYSVAVPMEKYEEIKGGKKVEKERKIFPGYVLIKMIVTPTNWYLIRNTRGVTGFVGPDSEPVPLTKKEIREFGVEEEEPIEQKYSQEDLGIKIGDRIQVATGSFAGFEGVVEEINYEQGFVKTIISMFDRDTAAEIKFEDIEIL